MKDSSRSSRGDGIDRRDFVKTMAAAGPAIGLALVIRADTRPDARRAADP